VQQVLEEFDHLDSYCQTDANISVHDVLTSYKSDTEEVMSDL
jgi:hypothetical protein